jgi:FKBP-type peptidyl-prolyl cis-trans isomerase FklB
VGSKWEVFIPQNLAYGTTGIPSDSKKGEYVIPPSSTLIFEIELLSIVD